MKNKILHTLIYIILNILIYSNVSKSDQFNFDVTEIEILDNGNIIKGSKKGSIKTNDGITITGDTFIYNKKLNMLTAEGNVVIKDSKKNLEIYAENLIYEKSKEIITTNTNSKVILDKNKYIYANSFKLNRNTNTFNANGNVKLEETSKDYLMTGNNLTYFKDFEKIITVGDTETLIENKYKIASKDCTSSSSLINRSEGLPIHFGKGPKVSPLIIEKKRVTFKLFFSFNPIIRSDWDQSKFPSTGSITFQNK